MKIVLLLLGLSGICCSIAAQNMYQLAPPLLQYNSIYFTDSAKLVMHFGHPGASIHYTTNGKEPGEHDSGYTLPVVIKQDIITIKAKAFAPGFLPSETTGVTFLKTGAAIASINGTAPDSAYPGRGLQALSDNLGGINGFNAPTWLGFKNDTVHLALTLTRPQQLNAIYFGLLRDENGWIFLPRHILVSAQDKVSGQWKSVSEIVTGYEKPSPGAAVVLQPATFSQPFFTDRVNIQMIAVEQMPDWHPSKGNHAWIFIDEIKVY